MSRSACRQFIFDDEAKACFISILHKQAAFSGLDLLSFCVMGDHFHLLVAVPEKCEIEDDELLRRYRLLYKSGHCPPSSPEPKVLSKLLVENAEPGRLLRRRIVARMHDLSVFMRELKQRFGIWYNHRHGNRGTLWAERFKSLIVEPSPEALSTVAAYIDLNPVRAEIVSDPADYRFSSFGRAMGGDRAARDGYKMIFCGLRTWSGLLPSYVLILYGKGAISKGRIDKDKGRIAPEKLQAVLESGGRLPLAELLRLRVRYFTAGTAIGSAKFLQQIAQEWKAAYGLERKKNHYAMRSGDWGEIRSFRNLRVAPIGRGLP